MGGTYFASVTQWSKGEYTNASRPAEDDVAIIALSAPYIPDDYGDTTASASWIQSNQIYRGLISSAADVDMFRFPANPGALTITVQLVPDWVKEFAVQAPVCRTNLDVLLQVLDSKGVVLATNDSLRTGYDYCTNLPTNISFAIQSWGTYYIAIRGTGFLQADTGYTSYGSIGSYSMTASFTPGPVSPPPPPSPPAPPPAVLVAELYKIGSFCIDTPNESDGKSSTGPLGCVELCQRLYPGRFVPPWYFDMYTGVPSDPTGRVTATARKRADGCSNLIQSTPSML
jgi:hypothetical protein